METSILTTINNINFPEPSKGWLKSYCEQTQIRVKDPNDPNTVQYGRIKNLKNGRIKNFRIYCN
jgi:hypothetical protein